MDSPTLLVLSVGELGSSVLEAAARSGDFGRIIIAGRSGARARERANGAMIGAALEGHYPRIEAEELDVGAPDFVPRLRALQPDIVLTTASLMPWWRIDRSDAVRLPFGGYVSLHLAVITAFRDRLAEAGLSGVWVNASYPDVLNPVLHRTGFGPLCGIGNVQEPVPKLRIALGRQLGLPPAEVSVRLVAQHAFEYYAFSDTAPARVPPYLLHAEAGGRDVTDAARAALLAPFPFRYDLFFNRVTASAAIEAFRGLLSSDPVAAHLPGVNGLIGGYPVILRDRTATLDLHPSWTEAQAVAVNEEAMRWEGIEDIAPDGEIRFTEATQRAFHALLGRSVDRVCPRTAPDQARALLGALQTTP